MVTYTLPPFYTENNILLTLKPNFYVKISIDIYAQPQNDCQMFYSFLNQSIEKQTRTHVWRVHAAYYHGRAQKVNDKVQKHPFHIGHGQVQENAPKAWH